MELSLHFVYFLLVAPCSYLTTFALLPLSLVSFSWKCRSTQMSPHHVGDHHMTTKPANLRSPRRVKPPSKRWHGDQPNVYYNCPPGFWGPRHTRIMCCHTATPPHHNHWTNTCHKNGDKRQQVYIFFPEKITYFSLTKCLFFVVFRFLLQHNDNKR